MDTTLVFAAKRGDQDAFAALYREFRVRVWSWIRNYWIPGADREDLMQHAWIGFWEAIRDYDVRGKVPFLAFAKMCVVREIQTVLRMARRQKHTTHLTALSLDAECPWIEDAERTVLDVFVDPAAPSVEDVVFGPPKGVSAEELVAWAERHWGLRLTELEREVWRLRIEGHSYAEIQRMLGCGYKTVDNAVQRLRKKARKALARQEQAAS
ncbi:sigma-70 family RNA polymerase sigma factor [Alicyclobacillus acidocaldarius]|uniref:RNA polymerase sigma factor SigS n=1 Tax=Alicyclobacillus acidocaldarius subsp. acidocaldarius (strain ATCC 27009 / DSM 446 / BCRC 14685 / JCM 5260 / KCTC 1825 / NBRC 15652 / NCIMB 11725 / NRRL B-14509 / 104-IA) TaxID=521098 RepID=C8WYJ0_ALIAD|nr:sigma-70 family RNA polymerase sigma factor [Alicyclobacillus acidocaldarius]ACV60084.1 RNA polymerase, sigma-24 subunit, ECF subfamily [Alicyclobacillus acidocaldarius subsp. acidocaldarius DSM 446]